MRKEGQKHIGKKYPCKCIMAQAGGNDESGIKTRSFAEKSASEPVDSKIKKSENSAIGSLTAQS